MNYLLDTDTCVYWLNGVTTVREHLDSVGIEYIAISAITLAELYFGAYKSAHVSENIDRAEQFAESVSLLPLNQSALMHFGRIKTELRKIGQPIADFDLLIAATALSDDRILITNNVRHYARIPTLRIENWL